MSKPMSSSGKGSFRRNEDTQKVHDNWDTIFGKKQDMNTMNDDSQDLSEDNKRSEFSEDEGEWTCDVCGGPMYSAAHWNYGKCDDCGATQELINDDYL